MSNTTGHISWLRWKVVAAFSRHKVPCIGHLAFVCVVSLPAGDPFTIEFFFSTFLRGAMMLWPEKVALS